MVLLRASTAQSRFSILGQKLGRALIKNKISIRFLFQVSTAKWKTTKSQRGGAEGAALLFSIWQWKPGIKSLMEISFSLRAGPTFGPKLKTDFGRCWPLIKTPRALNKKLLFSNLRHHYTCYKTETNELHCSPNQ